MGLKLCTSRAASQRLQAECFLNHTGNFETLELDVTKNNIKKQLLAETVQTVERAEKAWRRIVVVPDDYERVHDQAFDRKLFDDDPCELEPDGDAVDEFDPLGDELSDGEEDDTGQDDHPPEDPEDAQHDVTIKPEPPAEDTAVP